MNTSICFQTRFLPVLLLAGSLAFISVPAGAASSSEPVAEEGRVGATLVEHLRTEIRMRDALRRERALVDVVALTSCQASCTIQLQSLPGKTLRIDNETGAGTVMDLSALVPELMRTYRSGPSDGHRLLALAALLNIGNEASFESLVENPVVVSERVARATQNGLVAFYLARYPELTERALRTGTVFLGDVRIARARQERALRQQMRKG